MSSTRHTNERTRTARARARQPGRIKAGALMSLATATVLMACSSTTAGPAPSAPVGPTTTGNVVGGAPPAPATNEAQSGHVTPCDLLTVDEIKTATGLTAQPGKPQFDDNTSCKWELDSQSVGSTVSVDLVETALYPGLAPGTAVKVSGVGDEALWADGLFVLYVKAGQRVFSVQVALLYVKQQPIAQALALDVLAHL